MTEKILRYLKILDVELQDLLEDIDLRIATQNIRKERGEITEYVGRENVALLVSERRALERFLEELSRFDTEAYHEVKELEAGIEKKFTSFLVDHGFPHAIESFVTRKMRKVLQFCQCE